MLGVFIHVMGDALNNIGVIVAAVIVWKASGEGRYYADPAVGVFIALMILFSALPLAKKSGGFLLQTAPGNINLDDIKHDIEKVRDTLCTRLNLTTTRADTGMCMSRFLGSSPSTSCTSGNWTSANPSHPHT